MLVLDLSDLDAEDGEINDLEEGELRSDGDDSDPINTLEKVFFGCLHHNYLSC